VTAAGLLDRAAAAGVQLRVEPNGAVKVLARPSDVPPDLLSRDQFETDSFGCRLG